MSPRAYIKIKNGVTGADKVLLTDNGQDGFLQLAWKKIVNGIHYSEFMLNSQHPDISLIASDDILEIWRYDTAIGLAPYQSLIATIQDDQYKTDSNNLTRITFKALGYNAKLARRIIAYDSDKALYTKFTSLKGETLLKRLVRDNCDPACATTGNGRDRTPSTMNLTIEADAARGNTLASWACGTRNNLLTELQKIVLIAGGDFDVVALTSTTFEFRFYSGQLGTDRSSGANAVIFSTDRGNMSEPMLTRARSNEKTVAIIGGSGQAASRIIRTRNGPNFSTVNDVEVFVDGRNNSDNDILDTLGDATLENMQFRNQFNYKVLQTPLYTAEKDYFLGDLVKAANFGLTVTQQVYEMSFAHKDGRENANVVMRDH